MSHPSHDKSLRCAFLRLAIDIYYGALSLIHANTYHVSQLDENQKVLINNEIFFSEQQLLHKDSYTNVMFSEALSQLEQELE